MNMWMERGVVKDFSTWVFYIGSSLSSKQGVV